MYKLPIQRWCCGQKHKVLTKICDAYTTYTRAAEWPKTQSFSHEKRKLYGNIYIIHCLVQVKNMMYKRPIQRWCSGRKHKFLANICDIYTTYRTASEC